MRHATALGAFYRVEMFRALSLLRIGRRVPSPKPTLAERILRLLAEDPAGDGWLTRARLHERLGKPPRAELTAALDQLIITGFVTQRRQALPHAKRPVLSYRLVGGVQ